MKSNNFLNFTKIQSIGYGFFFGSIVSFALFFSLTYSQYTIENKIGFLNSHFFNLKYILISIPFVFGLFGWVISSIYIRKVIQLEKYMESQEENRLSFTDFAKKIGSGIYDAELDQRLQKDLLGQSLIDMRDDIVENNKNLENQNWITYGTTELSDILRNCNHLNEIGDKVLPFITKKMSSIQSAFYFVDEETKRIDLVASYAYDKKKYLNSSFRIGEGLVGEAVFEKDIVLRTEIPEKYSYFTSGLLGDKKPKSIIISPLIVDEKVVGALELASINDFSTLLIDFLNEINPVIARTILNLKFNDLTVKLLEESQALSKELQEREFELKQNSKAMELTQEQLTFSNEKLEFQIDQVSNAQKRIHSLLENASEIITICDKFGSVSYVSPSIINILGYDPIEIVGTKEEDRIHPKGKHSFTELFDQLVNKKIQNYTLEYSYLSKDGEFIWLETFGKNMLHDESIKGIIINLRDITERRRAEKESRMRSQMQSLSENSPDLICRLNKEGIVYYINPTITLLTGFPVTEFNQKHIKLTNLDTTVVEVWDKYFNRVIHTKEKHSSEFVFETQFGQKTMSLNAIPEFGNNNLIESVLLVSSDITERKRAEIEIKVQNQKITESINYSKRIQNAILPTEEDILHFFPNSFMYYKPKDVVSGDFPWLMTYENYVYIAVVDCTGHGVPGAMLSLIGYFLLSEIIRTKGYESPSKILDLLDQNVTATLKQEELNSETKDGMDIALCKFNLKTKEIEYSGAHRPLYFYNGEEVVEYKGNKFAIGGGKTKNQTEFTNYYIKPQKENSFYFFSDGYPDQFGGIDNKKIGSQKVRNIINLNANVNEMKKMKDIFANEFETWKGSNKQMDDVLFIGIKI